jgi:hypothetical protein
MVRVRIRGNLLGCCGCLLLTAGALAMLMAVVKYGYRALAFVWGVL